MYDSIIELKKRILPLDITLSSEMMVCVSDDIKNACRQLYDYKVNLYNCILSNPERYFLNIEGRMLNVYGFFVEKLVMFEENSNGNFVLSENDFDLCLEGHHKGINKILKKNNITFSDKIAPLSDLGWNISQNNSLYIINNFIYPQIMLAARPFVNLAKKSKSNYYHYMIRSLDFRILTKPTHLQTANDIIRLLPENLQEGANEVYNYINELKLKNNPYTMDHISFSSKNKNICSLRRDHFYIPLGEEHEANEFMALCEPYIQKFIYKYLNYCTNCVPSHNGGAKYRLLDRQVKVCSKMGVRFKKFDEQIEVETVKKLICITKDRILSRI